MESSNTGKLIGLKAAATPLPAPKDLKRIFASSLKGEKGVAMSLEGKPTR